MTRRFRRLCCALIATASALAGPAPAAPPAMGVQDLADLLPRPADLWIEVPDLDRLTTELAQTQLAGLLRRLSAGFDAEDLAMRLALPEDLPEDLLEDPPGSVRELLRRLGGELGLPDAEVELLVEGLAGSLTIAVLAKESEGLPGLPPLVVSAQLRPGASNALVDSVVAALERGDLVADGPELVELLREEGESRAAWRWRLPGGRLSGYLVVSAGQLAWCFERDTALALLHARPSAQERPGDALAGRRAASRAAGDLLFLRLAGTRLARLLERPQSTALLHALDLESLESFELGLGTDSGALLSRVRFGKPAGTPKRAPQGRAAWTSLDVLPSDCLVVLGVRASPAELGRHLGYLDDAWGGRQGGELVARLERAPFFADLGRAGALRSETLAFVRTAGGGAPMIYLATPSTPDLERPFAQLVERGHDDLALGADLRLTRKRLGSSDAWVVFDDEGSRARSLFALAPIANTWVVSDVSAQLQNLLRQRERERLAVREEQLHVVRRALWRGIRSGGHRPDQLRAFVHVNGERVLEWVWPYALLGLQLTGEVDDPEELPETFELAEFVGDTTTLVFDLDDAVELRGRGLLGGLLLLL